ncbi:hypothetical protein BCR32DRAFT_330576 [Anaeromyces robustus]|uniref:Uncharacterized protein n=1 Tax=Anaeromyces robustus TaxID=1754192 RepID=A0A1Y1VTG2_9FUNG|nr:hypothetical protein BCR32DRAFT_330576 [Anaeromyces robustus]|eukprot:ORX64568.1 hypothetical protein BCR32DRAFT_330576 [Anaeromyces robustus]
MEKNLNDYIQNKHMIKIIKKAIKKTEPGKPLLIFPKKDAWYILNTILNQIACQFSDGTLKNDMGIMNVTSQWYTFCLTYEKDCNVLMQKIRIMIIKRELLKNFPDETISFLLESETHDVRVQTLRTLSKELIEHPECFMDIEICQ